jgi:hypothetical protein
MCVLLCFAGFARDVTHCQLLLAIMLKQLISAKLRACHINVVISLQCAQHKETGQQLI